MGVSKTCRFPFNFGSLTFDGVAFPIKKGPQKINVDLLVSRLLPAGLVKTTTQITTVSKSGDKIFCIKVFTGKSEANGILPLSYEDCGDAATHVKITDLQPTSVKLGEKTRITGSGNLDEDIADGTFHLQTFYSGGDLLDCSGDASKTSKCALGGFLGSLTFDGLTFPMKKGTSSVSVELSLSSLIPASLASTSTKLTAATKNGDKIFCMEVFSAKQGNGNSMEMVV